ncbi:CaiB/BaiF CoA-transferase family protein [Jatrophihabitans fulvus]
MTDDERPLAGVRVLDLADARLASVGRHLADLGATVLRDATAAGDDIAAAVRDANKYRAAGDVTDLDLALVTPPQSFDVAGARAANPRLVVVTLTDFGTTGPRAHWRGTPAVHHAVGTVLSRSGLPERPEPLLPPDFLAYEAAAAQAAWVCVLAYTQALRTGVGDDVDFSVHEAVLQTLDPGMGIGGSARAGAPMRTLPRGRPDARHLYPIFPVADGFVRVCILSARQWRGMFEWLGRPEEFADPEYAVLGARFQAAGTLYPLIGRMLAPLTRERATAAGQALGVPVAGLASPSEALATEAFAGSFTTLALPDGRTATVPRPMLELDGVRGGVVPLSSDAPDGPRPTAPAPVAEPGSMPFAGLRVLDLGVIVVGGELGRLFADYGADVVKIESSAFPDGNRQSWDGSEITEGFAWGHRNKRSLGLDLRHEGGKALFGELVAGADVVLTNFKPGTLESLGFGWDALRAINPRLVLSESSAFGRTGPWAGRLGYGPLVRASTGLSSLWRYPDRADGFCDAITIFPDHVVARFNAAAVASLLLRRERTGRGGRVSSAQVDAIFTAMADLLALESVRPGSIDAMTTSSATLYPALGDDEWLVVDGAAPDELTGGDVAAWAARTDAREAAALLQEAGVPAGELARVTDLEGDPHLVARGFFGRMHQPQFADDMPAMSNEARFTTLPPPRMDPAPLMAEHTREVAHDLLGLSSAEIDTLVADGVLELHVPRPTAR